MQRIAAAVDLSKYAPSVVARAALLAECWGATLTLVHVYESAPVESSSLYATATLDAQRRQTAEASLQELEKSRGLAQAKTIVESASDIPGTICDILGAERSDMIVVGTHGRAGIDRFFMGSVAERVVRRAPCPVWVERPASRPDLERLVVCTDMSALSLAGLDLASVVAQGLGLAVEVVHVLEPSYHGLAIETRREIVSRLRERLAALAASRFEPSVTPRLTVLHDDTNAVDSIVTHLSRTSADLVVLATHGHTGLRRAFMGSVAERVVRFSPCSVLVGRSPFHRST